VSNENPKLKPDARGPAARDPAARDTPASQPGGVTRNNSGRVTFDDRGNAVWEWAVATGSFGTDVSTSRLKKLENHTLSLADDTPPPARANDIVKPNPKGVSQGYSPYDSGLLAKTGRPTAKKKDLRRLGEFIKLREQATRNKRDKD
jgi:hypothetical protein